MSERAPQSGWHKMEEAVAAAQAAAPAIEAMHEAEQAKQAAIEAFRVSPKMQQLNDAAEIAIYGTRGRTTGYINPATRKPLTQPIPGKIEEIRQSRRYGTKEAERVPKADAAAELYKKDAEELVGEGYELCQAKLIMDKREERAGKIAQEKTLLGKVSSQFVKNGMTRADADAAAKKRLAPRMTDWEKEDKKLKDLVRTEGIFTPEQYDQAINAGEDPTRKMPITPEPNKHAPDKKSNNAQKKPDPLQDVRSEYARLSAGRATKAFPFGGKFSASSVAKAKEEYDTSKQALIRHNISMDSERAEALRAGVSPEDFDKYAAAFLAIEEAEKLAVAARDERLLATGKWEFQNVKKLRKGDVKALNMGNEWEEVEEMVRKKPESIRERLIGRYNEWWGDDADANLFSKETPMKSVTALGATVGVPAAVVGGAIVAPVVAGAVIGAAGAGKAANSILNHGSRYRSKDELRAGQFHEEHVHLAELALKGRKKEKGDEKLHKSKKEKERERKENKERLEALGKLDNIVDSQTQKEINRHRRRVAATIGAAAVGSVAGGIEGAS